MDKLVDLFVYKAVSNSDWIESGVKDKFVDKNKNIREIKVNINVGSINIMDSSSREVKITTYKKLKSKDSSREEIDKRLREDILVDIYEKENIIYIESKHEDENIINKNIETSLDIELPKYIDKISIDMEIGNILIKNIESNLDLESKIGNITIENYKGSLDIKAGVGNIMGDDLLLDFDNKIELATGNIDIAIVNLDGECLYLASNMGNIKLGILKELKCNIEKKRFLLDKKTIDGDREGMEIVVDSKLGSIDVYRYL